MFEDIKGKKFYNFSSVKEKVHAFIEYVAGSGQSLVDNPLKFSLYSPFCPDLTVVDTPGVFPPPKSSANINLNGEISFEIAQR